MKKLIAQITIDLIPGIRYRARSTPYLGRPDLHSVVIVNCHTGMRSKTIEGLSETKAANFICDFHNAPNSWDTGRLWV